MNQKDKIASVRKVLSESMKRRSQKVTVDSKEALIRELEIRTQENTREHEIQTREMKYKSEE